MLFLVWFGIAIAIGAAARARRRNGLAWAALALVGSFGAGVAVSSLASTLAADASSEHSALALAVFSPVASIMACGVVGVALWRLPHGAATPRFDAKHVVVPAAMYRDPDTGSDPSGDSSCTLSLHEHTFTLVGPSASQDPVAFHSLQRVEADGDVLSLTWLDESAAPRGMRLRVRNAAALAKAIARRRS